MRRVASREEYGIRCGTKGELDRGRRVWGTVLELARTSSSRACCKLLN